MDSPGDQLIIAPHAQQTTLDQAVLCAKLCADYRGSETVVLDLRHVTPIFDFFVITTGTSRRQMIAIAEAADQLMKAAGSKRLGMEGHEGGTWLLHDYGDIVLHVLDGDSRETYALERLWADAKKVDWQSLVSEGLEEGRT